MLAVEAACQHASPRGLFNGGEVLQDGGIGGVRRRAVAVSARTGQGIPELVAAIDEALPEDPLRHATFRLPLEAGLELHLLHEFGWVSRKEFDATYCFIEAEVPDSLLRRLERFLVAAPRHRI